MTAKPLPIAGDVLPYAEKIAWLRLLRAERVGPVTFYRLMERFGTAERALEALPNLARKGGGSLPAIPPPAAAEREMEALARKGGRLVAVCEAEYPLPLAATEDAPPLLSMIGRTGLVSRQCVGVVGARNASINGRRFAETLSRDLGMAGLTVVSGLARGIDTSAHEGSLSTGTVAVVAGGIDVVYPPENRALYERIAQEGLIVAESPLGQQPFAQSFPRRNRIVSGLSAGVVVVEATERSGSLITARMAAEQGRDVYAVPGHPLDPRAAGPNSLIRDGAILARHAADVLEGIGSYGGGAMRESASVQAPYYDAPLPHATDDGSGRAREALEGGLSFTPVCVDELIRRTGVTPGDAQTALLEMELGGRIQRLPGNRVVLAGQE